MNTNTESKAPLGRVNLAKKRANLEYSLVSALLANADKVQSDDAYLANRAAIMEQHARARLALACERKGGL